MNSKAAAQVRSDVCVLDELISPYGSPDEARTPVKRRSRSGNTVFDDHGPRIHQAPG
ncbi:hypothetical protein [Streptomyces albofaciens]|uniref:hypothetical protein n=1 Tax=Streptomyces albofaciens TaxID=66866 RepID=UPI00142EE33C|nr:hypothetical protein [Streptomyces albofaciens]